MQERLRDTLRRTGFRASLAPEYLDGRAPGAQKKRGQRTEVTPSYYGIPPIKKPGWKWYIPAYFFAGGTAAGAYITAVLADIAGRKEDQGLVRAGYWIALLGMLISPVLLILDLGRPDRWYNMLRVFRPRSMMNAGSWAISIFGGFAGLASLTQLLLSLAPAGSAARIVLQWARVFSWLGLVPAVFVGFYTALLLTATNVALWAKNRVFMGPLFFCSALSNGLAASHLVAKALGSGTSTEQRVKSAETIVLATEVAATVASFATMRGLAKPLVTGKIGAAYLGGSLGLGVIGPLVIQKVARPGSALSLLSPILTLVGGVVLRFAVTYGGMKSADDPQAYFAYTRANNTQKTTGPTTVIAGASPIRPSAHQPSPGNGENHSQLPRQDDPARQRAEDEQPTNSRTD